MRTVAGLDPGLRSFGLCLYDLDTGDVRTASVGDKTPAKSLLGRLDRYDRIIAQVLAFLRTDGPEGRGEDPQLIAIEGYSFGSTGNAFAWTCECGGILRHMLVRQCRYEVVEIAPTTLKKFIIGKGGGKGTDKTGMALATFKRYGVEFGTSDETDAYGLARIAACLVGAEKPATTFQREVIAKLKEKPTAKRKAKKTAAQKV